MCSWFFFSGAFKLELELSEKTRHVQMVAQMPYEFCVHV